MTLYGAKGLIELPRFFSAPEVRLYKGGQLEEVFTQDCELPIGFTWEIEAVRKCMLSGNLQNPLMPAQATIQTARIMQELMHSFFPL